MRIAILYSLALTDALALAATVEANTQSVVDLGYATYAATLGATTGVTAFRGVRYASPPIGSLRFQAPKPPQVVRGVQQADTQPPSCLQAGEGIAPRSPFILSKRQTPSASEDCLFVNVFVPGKVNSNARLPVVFWIHGGGYMAGSSATFDGSDLVHEAGGGVIAVTVQYRLGLFGFLAGAEVKQKGALNAGLLDQRVALQWIQQHIRSFGGDPTRVTIWGESAGAGSVIQHMIADGGNTRPPLFQAGISSSLFIPPQYNFDDPIPEAFFREISQAAGCANATDAFDCLVAVDSNTLGAVNLDLGGTVFSGTFAFVPVVDGVFIRERPIQTILRGRLNGRTLLAVTNTFEGRIFTNAGVVNNLTLPDYVAQVFPTLSPAQAAAAAAQYEGIGLDGIIDQAIAVMGESIFICPTYILLQSFRGTSFKGEFAIPPGNHGDDVAYYFPGATGPPFNNTQFDASFSESFLAVVKSLNPNVTPDPNSITPQWARFAAGNTEMLFNRTEAGVPDIRPIITDNALLQRCSFWQSISSSTVQ